jgi:hypothetical protein
MRRWILLLGLAVVSGSHAKGGASELPWSVDIESGRAYDASNDVRIPGDDGTAISLTDDLSADATTFLRLRISWKVSERGALSVLVAPLRFESRGAVDRSVRFDDAVFPTETELRALYRFDSYRITYRRDFVRRESVRLGAGLTAKVRDAAIRLDGGGVSAEKTNTGVVPLVNFRAEYRMNSRWSVLLDGDALAAPQGRAEDVQIAVAREVGRAATLRLGYRVLEGGADNDEVYNFALVHYAALGATLRF